MKLKNKNVNFKMKIFVLQWVNCNSYCYAVKIFLHEGLESFLKNKCENNKIFGKIFKVR